MIRISPRLILCSLLCLAAALALCMLCADALADALKQDGTLDPSVSKLFGSLSDLFEQVKNEQTTLPADLPEGVPSELPGPRRTESASAPASSAIFGPKWRR